MLNALKKSFTSKIIKAVFMERPELSLIKDRSVNSKLGKHTKIYSLYNIENTTIDDYTYVSTNSKMINTTIGKFCSVGPNLVSGWGIHPTHTLSTSPMFYSTLKQNGLSLTQTDKFDETSRITIGNDVFIGMNVTILDGVTIGDGAVIGAGAVVSKDIPPYAIAVGSPIKVIKYRFDEETIKALLQIKWWNWPEDQLSIVEQELSNVARFVEKYKVS